MIDFCQNSLDKPYDVVLIGGAIYGSSIAWFISQNPDFKGKILVVERDPTYEFCSTSHTNSCIRQQFSQEINIQLSQFAADYINNFKTYISCPTAPEISLRSFGYMYLASDEESAENLRVSQIAQNAAGAKTKYLSSKEIKELYPFYNLKDIVGGNHNIVNEGFFDGNMLFEWWKKSAIKNGVHYINNEVIGMKLNKNKDRIEKINLKTGEELGAGIIINTSGPRASLTAKMAGIRIPVEPRKRFSFVFKAERPLHCDLPLTIDPSGVHFRSDGRNYLAGCTPDHDPPVDYDDFSLESGLWETKIWPIITKRIPQFDKLRLINEWAGHYAYNTLDQNAIVGFHSKVKNFFFANGFSGHGLQHSPGIGRGVSELIIYNKYKTLDLNPLGFSRIENDRPFLEKAII